MEPLQQLGRAMGAAWTSGINLYATVAALGIAQAAGLVQLPPGLDVLANPAVIAVAVVMYFVEFFADKVPYVDSGWDAVHTFIRVPAGALLAARAPGPAKPPPRVGPAPPRRKRCPPPPRTKAPGAPADKCRPKAV